MPIGPDVFTNSPTGFEVATGAQIAAGTNVPSLDPNKKIMRIFGGALAAIAGLGLTTAYLNDTVQHASASNPESRGPIEPGCVIGIVPVDPNSAHRIDGETGLAYRQSTSAGAQNAPNFALPSVGGVAFETRIAAGSADALEVTYTNTIIDKNGLGCDPTSSEASEAAVKAVQEALKTNSPVQLLKPVLNEEGKPTGKFRDAGYAPPENPLPTPKPSGSEMFRYKADVCTVHLAGDSMVATGNNITDKYGANPIVFGKYLTEALSKRRAALKPGDVSIVSTNGFLDRATEYPGSGVNGIRAPNYYTLMDKWFKSIEIDSPVAVLSLTRNDASSFLLDPAGFEASYLGVLRRLAWNSPKLKHIFAIGNKAFDRPDNDPHELVKNIPLILAAQSRAIEAFQKELKEQGRDLQITQDTLSDFTEEDYELNPRTGKREAHFSQGGVDKLADRIVAATRESVCLPKPIVGEHKVYFSLVNNNTEGPPAIPTPDAPITTTEPITSTIGTTGTVFAQNLLHLEMNGGVRPQETWQKRRGK